MTCPSLRDGDERLGSLPRVPLRCTLELFSYLPPGETAALRQSAQSEANPGSPHPYLITPRSLRSRKWTSAATSSPSRSLIRSNACDVFSFATSSSRNAFCSSRILSGEKPLRCSPTLFTPNALFSRRDDVFEYG